MTRNHNDKDFVKGTDSNPHVDIEATDKNEYDNQQDIGEWTEKSRFDTMQNDIMSQS